MSDRDADARGDLDLLALHLEADAQSVDDAVGDEHRSLEVALIVQQHGELVAAQARRNVLGRSTLRSRSPTSISSRSPAACPSVSLTILKSSRSRNRTTRLRVLAVSASRSVTRSRKSLRLGRLVKRVVIGLVAQLLLEPRQLGQRLLQVAVLEGRCGLVGQRLEQAQVVVAEGRAFGQPVGDEEGAPSRSDSPRSGLTMPWRTRDPRPGDGT